MAAMKNHALAMVIHLQSVKTSHLHAAGQTTRNDSVKPCKASVFICSNTLYTKRFS